MQQRFGLGCVSGAVAHAVFYPLEVSECKGTSESFSVSFLFIERLTAFINDTFRKVIFGTPGKDLEIAFKLINFE